MKNKLTTIASTVRWDRITEGTSNELWLKSKQRHFNNLFLHFKNRIKTHRYLKRNNCNHSPLQSTQVNAETLADLFKESQVQWDPKQSVKHTEDLTRHCAWREVAIACEPSSSEHVSALEVKQSECLEDLFEHQLLTYSCDNCACKEEGTTKVPVTGVR